MSCPQSVPTPASYDSPEFIDALRAGDDDAFERLVRANALPLHAVARRLLGNEEDARDAVQEGLLAAFRALPDFEGRARVSTWLYRIVVNQALMKLRTRRRHAEESLDDARPALATPEALTPGTDETLERAERHALVWRAIDRLPLTYRKVVLLRDIAELDTSEAALALGVSTNAVKVRLHRARQSLRTLLAPHVDDALLQQLAS